ncbi:hypothetical protein ACU686_44665 [Yinghuangia aomiensis]
MLPVAHRRRLVVAVPERLAADQEVAGESRRTGSRCSTGSTTTRSRGSRSAVHTTEGLLGVVAVSASMAKANADPTAAAMKTFAFRSNITDAETPRRGPVHEVEQACPIRSKCSAASARSW